MKANEQLSESARSGLCQILIDLRARKKVLGTKTNGICSRKGKLRKTANWQSLKYCNFIASFEMC